MKRKLQVIIRHQAMVNQFYWFTLIARHVGKVDSMGCCCMRGILLLLMIYQCIAVASAGYIIAAKS